MTKEEAKQKAEKLTEEILDLHCPLSKDKDYPFCLQKDCAWFIKAQIRQRTPLPHEIKEPSWCISTYPMCSIKAIAIREH